MSSFQPISKEAPKKKYCSLTGAHKLKTKPKMCPNALDAYLGLNASIYSP